ncbi:MAG: hypothetical protein LBE23_05780 [Vagococcus sp.]|jgi:hypothetical protein|nr:hypothetical protein [Vagococcus sp.]
MDLQALFNDSFVQGTIESSIKQIIYENKSETCIVTHQNSGEDALKAAEKQIENHKNEGGVIHYERQLDKMTEPCFYSSVLVDLYFITQYFGKIQRLKVYSKKTEDSQQVFITIRLQNRMIVQYVLNSLKGLRASFKFDFSKRGFNLDYDNQIQASIKLNSKVLLPEEFETTLTAENLLELKNIYQLLSESMKGGK